MTTIVRSRRYGAELSLDIQSFPKCCGAHIIHRFSVEHGDCINTEEKKHKMYEELMYLLRGHVSGVLIAADAILNFGEWANLKRATSSATKTEGAGDISLEDFCEFFDFTRGTVAKNKNSGNLVASYSKAMFQVSEDEKTVTDHFPRELPDFSDDDTKSSNGDDVEEVIATIRRILNEEEEVDGLI